MEKIHMNDYVRQPAYYDEYMIQFVVLERGSAKYVKVNYESGYTSDRSLATIFHSISKFFEMKKENFRYRSIPDDMFEFVDMR
jgi:hypothetical protein